MVKRTEQGFIRVSTTSIVGVERVFAPAQRVMARERTTTTPSCVEIARGGDAHSPVHREVAVALAYLNTATSTDCSLATKQDLGKKNRVRSCAGTLRRSACAVGHPGFKKLQALPLSLFRLPQFPPHPHPSSCAGHTFLPGQPYWNEEQLGLLLGAVSMRCSCRCHTRHQQRHCRGSQ